MNLKQACPDKMHWHAIKEDKMKRSMTLDPIGDMITIRRRNGEIRMKLGAYMTLTKGQKNKLHQLWEEN